MFEKASFVLIITGGFTIAILYLLKLMSIGVNISPMPVAYDGCGFMKKGLSAPNLAAKDCMAFIDIFRLNISFNIFIVYAQSDEPPPMPACVGIFW